jgi:nucleoid-associated protein EbfC
MFKGLGNLTSLMKQAQEVGSQMQAVNEQLKTKRTTGSAGGGLVEVEANGLGEVVRVKIEPSLVERGDREMIEDLAVAAFNQAKAGAEQLRSDAMRSMCMPVSASRDSTARPSRSVISACRTTLSKLARIPRAPEVRFRLTGLSAVPTASKRRIPEVVWTESAAPGLNSSVSPTGQNGEASDHGSTRQASPG